MLKKLFDRLFSRRFHLFRYLVSNDIGWDDALHFLTLLNMSGSSYRALFQPRTLTECNRITIQKESKEVLQVFAPDGFRNTDMLVLKTILFFIEDDLSRNEAASLQTWNTYIGSSLKASKRIGDEMAMRHV